MYTLTDFENAVATRVQDSANKLTIADRDDAISQAVRGRYSHDRPRELSSDVSGANPPAALLSLPTGPSTPAEPWEDGFSTVRSIEFPIGDVPPTYLLEDEWQIYRAPTGLKLLVMGFMPQASDTLRVIWTVRHTPGLLPPVAATFTLGTSVAGAQAAHTAFYVLTWTNSAGETVASAEISIAVPANSVSTLLAPATFPAGVAGCNVYASTSTGTETKQGTVAAGATFTEPNGGFAAGARPPGVSTVATTIPDSDFEACSDLAAAICAEKLAAIYAQTRDPSIAADVVNYRTKSQEYLALAKALRQRYFDHIGIEEDGKGSGAGPGAIAIGDMELRQGSGVDRLTHRRPR